jgi:hypothetical protein
MVEEPPGRTVGRERRRKLFAQPGISGREEKGEEISSPLPQARNI